MDLRVINYFLTVAQEGNITRAAEILHITQPTLSRQIMELEEELGATLIIRGKRHITLTEEGILFQERAKEISTLIKKTENEFKEQSLKDGGRLAIGCIQSLSSELMMKFIENFSKKYPKMRFDLLTGYSNDIKEKLDRGLIDIGLLSDPVEISKYNFLRLNQDEEWGVIVPKDDPLAQRDCIELREVADKPLIVPSRENIYNELLNWFGYENGDLHIFSTYDLIANSLILVMNGLGYAIGMRGPVCVRYNSEVKFIPLTPERRTKSVIVWRKNHTMTTAATLFLESIDKKYILR